MRCDADSAQRKARRGDENKKKVGKTFGMPLPTLFPCQVAVTATGGGGGGDEKSHNLFRLLSFLLDCPGWFQVFFCFLSVQTEGGHAAYQQQLETEADDRPLPNKHDLRLFLYFLKWSIRSRLPRGE